MQGGNRSLQNKFNIENVTWRTFLQSGPGADPVSNVKGGDFSDIWKSVSKRLCYCKRDEVYFI